MSTRVALAYSFLDRYAGLVLNIVSSMIIARLLTPADIGVFSVAMVLLSFVSAIRDMGAGQYIVQERELTRDRIRAAWTVQLGIGSSLALLVMAASWPVAHFYNEPRLTQIMVLLAFNFAVSPFGSLTYAWLMRELLFGKLAVMRFVSNLLGAAVSVGLAWKGFGPVSLAYGSLAATVANAVVAIAFRPVHFPWIPGGFHQIRRVVSFGSRISATTIASALAFGSPELFIGKLVNMSAVGLFSRANGLVTMFNKLFLDATISVAFSAFSRNARGGTNNTADLLRGTLYLTALGWTFFGLLAVFAEPIIRILYGPQWDQATSLTRYMAAGMSTSIPAALCTPVLTSVGRADLVLKVSVAAGGVYAAVMGAGAFLGFRFTGPAFIVGSLAILLIWIEMTRRELLFTWTEFVTAMFPSVKVAITALLPSFAASLILGRLIHMSIAMVIGVMSTSAMFVVACFAYRHPIAGEFRRLFATASERFSRGSRAT